MIPRIVGNKIIKIKCRNQAIANAYEDYLTMETNVMVIGCWHEILNLLLSVCHQNCGHQKFTVVAISTGYAREDPFRIGGTRRKLEFYFILGASLRR
ncbi:hypothetical protein AVEN_99498-1 [Araneus ventricosus]|uniref:Uncharacterized protein n=1 Tax=Araneus ventricosus TaxID=182803 RepID=A0A4Y2RA50_ARAVE|nr:hypothetical protein AVEN_99498-1 [Araneus ventricosus]